MSSYGNSNPHILNTYTSDNQRTSSYSDLGSLEGDQGKQQKTGKKTIRRKGWGEENQEKVQYAYEIGGERFVYLLNAENGEWTYKRKHPKVTGTVGVDYGFCGINNYYHPTIVKDHRFFTDWKWQMNQCYLLWKGGTTFYGAKHIEKQRKLFEIK